MAKTDTSPLPDPLRYYQARAEQALERWLPPADTHPRRLHEAMRYAALGGGKRLRPMLVYTAGEAVGSDPARLDAPACAVEMVHSYSLVHDDLPAMDDDDLRRGRATCHKAFDDATAILAGDALQALAFYVLAHDEQLDVPPAARVEMIETLALACGSRGMAGGQAIDLASVGQRLDIAQLEDMHIHKTGALIRASVRLGALSQPELDAERSERLDHYAKCMGLAFQIRDDILDVEGSTETLGKTSGADLVRDKPTYPALFGMDAARERARELHQEAVEAISTLGDAGTGLRALADQMVHRVY